MSENIDSWDELGDETWSGSLKYSQDIAARKQVTGQEYTQGSNQYETTPLEANKEVSVTECWMPDDRDWETIS